MVEVVGLITELSDVLARGFDVLIPHGLDRLLPLLKLLLEYLKLNPVLLQTDLLFVEALLQFI